MLKLNLSCGDDIRENYTNIDLYNPKAEVKCNVNSLPYEDNEVDEIFASHIIEHADYYEAKRWLKEWHRVLKSGGKLVIETPDFYNSCVKFTQLKPEERITMFGHFFAKSWVEGETHKFLYDAESLYYQLSEAGFKDVKFEEPTMHIANPNLRAVCTKS
jgi:predicted SAM-dependent methyltransferase